MRVSVVECGSPVPLLVQITTIVSPATAANYAEPIKM
jgi:hypothetical protein